LLGFGLELDFAIQFPECYSEIERQGTPQPLIFWHEDKAASGASDSLPLPSRST